MQTDVPAAVVEDLGRLGLAPDGATLDCLGRFLDMLLAANRQFNLTAVRDREAAWRRHVVDSLTLLPFLEVMPPGSTLVDVGTGGGLPGLPLAIARRDLAVSLLEATGKKAAFCRQTAADLGLANVRVLHDRAEVLGQRPEHRQRYDVAVCRAIGPMRQLLEYTLPLVRVGGSLLAMKGPRVERELEEAAAAMDLLGAADLEVFDAYPAAFGQHTVVVVLAKRRPTPRAYPRAPGVPGRAPL